jgi:uncharacterized membrane protein (UPF0182 family)
VKLRPQVDSDADGFFPYVRDPEMTKYVSWAAHSNIEATREGFAIVSSADGGPVNYVDYDVNTAPSTAALTPSSATVSDIRILDPNVVSQTFTQQQQIKNQYGFADKLDIDRYNVDGVTKDYVVGVRELDETNLQGNQTNWINKHTVYTHGLGFVAALDNTNDGGRPVHRRRCPPAGRLV